jgi:hypothetical protein
MESAATGIHNPPTQKTLVDPNEAGGQNAIALAAAAAKRAENATKQLKAGRGL